ncbi:cytochrome C oxidase subunit IV family protein [Mesorhizobium sp. ANAO-SY3R2]|uniref:cytochrome C oxidase subunit IV family protein n=1 Tax=Mesorhizobium sp. ANAO-SY3R2 TaxID=3166644 RepID=UPI00366E5037
MTEGSAHRLARTWLILLALTGASVLIVRFGGATTAIAFVLGLAVLKARLVILDFMGLRGDGEAVIRRALLGWCLILMCGAAAKAIALAMAAG